MTHVCESGISMVRLSLCYCTSITNKHPDVSATKRHKNNPYILWDTCTCFLPAHDFELFWNKADNVRNPSPLPPPSASDCNLQRVLECTPWRWAKKTHPKHGLSASTSHGCPCLPEVLCGSTSYTWERMKRSPWHQLERTETEFQNVLLHCKLTNWLTDTNANRNVF